MTCNIIACGESGAQWDGSGPSIGVNDAGKWGYPIDYLMVLDAPKRFTPQRQEIIRNTRLAHFLTNEKAWLREFYDPNRVEAIKYSQKIKQVWCTNGPELIEYRMSIWMGRLQKGRIQHSRTSPFAAISLAYLLGYKEINLYGVDFVTHKTWHPGNAMFADERRNYLDLIRQLKENGVIVKGFMEPVLA